MCSTLLTERQDHLKLAESDSELLDLRRANIAAEEETLLAEQERIKAILESEVIKDGERLLNELEEILRPMMELVEISWDEISELHIFGVTERFCSDTITFDYVGYCDDYNELSKLRIEIDRDGRSQLDPSYQRVWDKIIELGFEPTLHRKYVAGIGAGFGLERQTVPCLGIKLPTVKSSEAVF